jgi:hypothetical protein
LFSYRDSCPRCRNLSQGFQWGLTNLIKSVLKDPVFESRIDIADDFSSIILTSGQIPCKTIDRDVLAQQERVPFLGKDGAASSRHKLVLVSLR